FQAASACGRSDVTPPVRRRTAPGGDGGEEPTGRISAVTSVATACTAHQVIASTATIRAAPADMSTPPRPIPATVGYEIAAASATPSAKVSAGSAVRRICAPLDVAVGHDP